MWGPAWRLKERWAEMAMVRDAAQLVHETESFLTGRYAVELWARQAPVPGWAWVAALANAPGWLLEAWAADSGSQFLSTDSTARWWLALSVVSQDLLSEAVSEGCDVEELQRTVLLDMELVVDGPCTPGVLVGEVRRALKTHRDSPYI